ncbi:GATA zinc finger domain-containing protein 14-like [Gordionus sp. m RMFG-2023]|uniref:GATA zinc finger domain-containing protein 14-like n=1 Tax=Gordionus sp. m RMFG-2023 TaxID=3053472 RepID=UPI0031FC644B
MCIHFAMMDGYGYKKPSSSYKHHGGKWGSKHGKHHGNNHHSAYDKGHHGHSHGQHHHGHKDHGWKNWNFKKGYKHGYHAYGSQFGHGNKDYGHANKHYGGHHKDHGDKHWGQKHGGHHGHHDGHHSGHDSHWDKHSEHKRSLPDNTYTISSQDQIISRINKSMLYGDEPQMLFLNRQYPGPYINKDGRILMKEISLYQLLLNKNFNKNQINNNNNSTILEKENYSGPAKNEALETKDFKIASFISSSKNSDSKRFLSEPIMSAQNDMEGDDMESVDDSDDGYYEDDDEGEGREYVGVEGESDSGMPEKLAKA